MFSVRRDSWLTFMVCALIGTFIFIDTSDYPSVQTQGFGGGPAFYPQVLAAVLIALGALTIFRDLRHRKSVFSVGRDQGGAAPEVTYQPVIVFIALCVAAIVVMGYVGFLLSGFLLAFLSVLLIRASLKARHVTFGLLYSAGMMALVYVVFQVLVGIQLPGSLLFK